MPIKPKTDAAMMFALIHAMLHEHPRERLDLPFLRDSTSSPYLVGPHGYYLRDPHTLKPLLWDTRGQRAVPHDSPGIEPLLEGRVTVAQAVEVGADDERWLHDDVRRRHRVQEARRSHAALQPGLGGADLRRHAQHRSAASRVSSSIMHTSARRSRSTARSCRCGRCR